MLTDAPPSPIDIDASATDRARALFELRGRLLAAQPPGKEAAA